MDLNIFPIVPYRDFYRYAVAATYLGDADTTIAPQTDQKSLYIIPANTLTAARTYTFTNAGGTNTTVFAVLRLDRSANAVTLRNSTPTTLYTSGASPTADILYQFYYTAGAWTANTITFVQTT